MNFDNKYDGIDTYAIRLIKYKAGKLVKQPGFTESDRQDLEQEMVLDLFCRLPKFDSNQAQRNTFIARSIEHKAAKIVEARKAGIRDYRLCAHSLNECIEDNDGNQIEHIDTINQDEYFCNTGRHSRSLKELFELSLDMREIIASMPPNYYNLCKRLQEETITEILQNLGVSRRTVYRYIKEIRKMFENMGFKNYF